MYAGRRPLGGCRQLLGFGNARIPVERREIVRVLINQAHTFANGGGFDTGLKFT